MMKLTDLIKKLVGDYFIIFTVIIVATTILRQIFLPDKYFALKDIFVCMVGALLGDLPTLIFYSQKELSEKEIRLRIVIHFLLLEAVLLTFGYIIGLVVGLENTIFFACQIAVIYVLVRFFRWVADSRDANSINKKLRTIKQDIE